MIRYAISMSSIGPDLSEEWIQAFRNARIKNIEVIVGSFLESSEHAQANLELFRRMLRKPPVRGQWIVSGGAYVLAAGLLLVLLFGRIPAAGALAVMLTGDAAAALIGRRFGRHRAPNNKSWEGVAAFLLVGYGALALYLGIVGADRACFLAGAVAIFPAAAAELFEKQLRIDDNFSIPLIMGAALELAERFLL